MDSVTIFNQLKEYWFNNRCEDQFYSILEDKNISLEDREINSLDYLHNTFETFAKDKGYSELNTSLIEVIMNWGILMHLQIKDKLIENETNN